MKTSVLVTVLAAAALAVLAADINCSVVDCSCAAEGDKCVGDFIVNKSDCQGNEKCCGFPLWCIDGKCQEDTRDDACSSDDDCYPAAYGTHLITCIKKKCVVQGSFNDSCTKDDHCAGEQKCEKDKCAGLAEKAKCTAFGYQCGANKTCRGNVCVAALAVGDKCSTSDQCDVYSICNNGKCTERYSVKEGEKCDDKEGAACGKGLLCMDGKCKKGVKRQHIECTNHSDCSKYGNNSMCELCDATTGKTYCTDPEDVQPDCIEELSAAYKCYKKNGCAPVPSSSLDTCAQLECTAETNAIFACQTACEDFKLAYGKKCLSSLMLRYCPLLPTWVRIVIAFSILVVIILVVFVIYAIYNVTRKKDEYMEVSDGTPGN